MNQHTRNTLRGPEGRKALAKRLDGLEDLQPDWSSRPWRRRGADPSASDGPTLQELIDAAMERLRARMKSQP
jgi:hypothetical protein